MKKIITSVAAISMFATTSFAGSLVAPVPEMQPMVEVADEDNGSSGGLLVPLLALLAIGLLISSSSDSDTQQDSPT